LALRNVTKAEATTIAACRRPWGDVDQSGYCTFTGFEWTVRVDHLDNPSSCSTICLVGWGAEGCFCARAFTVWRLCSQPGLVASVDGLGLNVNRNCMDGHRAQGYHQFPIHGDFGHEHASTPDPEAHCRVPFDQRLRDPRVAGRTQCMREPFLFDVSREYGLGGGPTQPFRTSFRRGPMCK
jgi:hypothetical protein